MTNPFTIRGMILQVAMTGSQFESFQIRACPIGVYGNIIFFENSEPQSGIVYHWVKNLRESPKLTQEQTEALFQVAFPRLIY